VVEERAAAVFLRVTGRHTGELFGMRATGRSIDVRQMQIEHFRNGRICAHWRITDETTMSRQLDPG
jgi:predicted ester cyclase